MRRSWLIAVCAAGLPAPDSAMAGRQAGPARAGGGAGVSKGGQVNYVAVARGPRHARRSASGGSDGTVERGRGSSPGGLRRSRRRLRRLDHRAVRRRARTLVLARPARLIRRPARLLVLDTETLRVRKRPTLPEFVSVDAMSPDGRLAYVLGTPRRARAGWSTT